MGFKKNRKAYGFKIRWWSSQKYFLYDDKKIEVTIHFIISRFAGDKKEPHHQKKNLSLNTIQLESVDVEKLIWYFTLL
jgi:hypothetical protein